MAQTPYNTTGYGGAQILPDNPYNPLERMAQLGLSPGGQTKTEKAQFEKDRQEGFDPEEIEAWEDTKSHEELAGAMDDLKQVWQQSFASGFNIANPGNKKELMLQKAFNDKLSEVQRASDLYKSQGERYKNWKDIIDRDKDRLDVEGTKANVSEWMKKDIFGRAESFDQQLKWKAEPVDVVSHTMNNLGRMVGMEKETIDKGIDPETGKIRMEIFENIPIDKRRKALRTIWQMGDDNFKQAVANSSREDITANLDPNSETYMKDVGDWYVSQFEHAKDTEKRTTKLYSLPGGGIEFNFGGSGIPEIDPETNKHIQKDDTVQIHNSITGKKDDHTSPSAVYLQGQNMYGVDTPAKALAISITDDYINTETGLPENLAGTYSVLPTKVVWLNVMEDDVESQPGYLSILGLGSKGFGFKKGQVLSDEQVDQVNKYNRDNLGMPPSKYKKVPFVIGRMKYGQVETTDEKGKDKIESFNRSFRVPLEILQDNIRAHKGKAWDNYQKNIDDITRELNEGWGTPAPKKSRLDM